MTAQLPAPGAVWVWILPIRQVETVPARLFELLDGQERLRAESILAADRRTEFVVSHAAVRLLLGDVLGVAATELRWRHGPHGKPEILYPATPLRFNLSHSGGLAALAVSTGRPVGIDLQRRRRGVDPVRLAARYFAPEEAAFVAAAAGEDEQSVRFGRLWCRKEACVKVGGGRLVPGLRWPAGRLDHGPAELSEVGEQLEVPEPCQPSASEPAAHPGRCLVRDLPAPSGFDAAVAVAGTADFSVVSRWWHPEANPVARHVPDSMVVGRCSTMISS